jgi:hypothetical protein
MALTIQDFVTMIAGTLNRSVAALTSGSINHVIVAANNAKREAQKLLDFEVCKVLASVSVSLQNGGDLSTAVLAGTSTAVTINRILRATINFDGADRPAEIVTRASMFRRFKLRWDEVTPWVDWTGSIQQFLPSTPLIYRLGTKIYVWPGTITGMTTPVTVGLDVVKWLPDYVYQRQLSVQPVFSGGGGVNLGSYFLLERGSINGYSAFFTDTYINSWYTGNGLPNAAQIMIVYFDSIKNKWRFQVSGQKTDGTPIYLYQVSNIAGPNGLVGRYVDELSLINQTDISIFGVQVANTDFFLDEGLDWLTLRTLKAMNYFIKDDHRYSINQGDINNAWGGLVAWNSASGDNSDSEGVTLD